MRGILQMEAVSLQCILSKLNVEVSERTQLKPSKLKAENTFLTLVKSYQSDKLDCLVGAKESATILVQPSSSSIHSEAKNCRMHIYLGWLSLSLSLSLCLAVCDLSPTILCRFSLPGQIRYIICLAAFASIHGIAVSPVQRLADVALESVCPPRDI